MRRLGPLVPSLLLACLAGCGPPAPSTRPGAVWTNGLGMDLVCVPPGEFRMGSTDAEVEAVLERFADLGARRDRLEPELPAHRVRITRPFLMARHEVTVGLFRRFVQATGHRTDAERRGRSTVFDAEASQDWFAKPGASWRSPGFPQGHDHPVVCVSWNDAQAFLRWLNRADGRKPRGWAYRLPTEAEWELAARGPQRREFAWGDAWDRPRANFADARSRLPWADHDADDGHPRTAPVGAYSPRGDTPLGIADLTGNVWEWCADGFRPQWYRTSPATDPVCRDAAQGRVERGGSWAFTKDYCRAAFRFRCPPAESYDTLGFRVVLAPGE